jgi:2'-5' RNA ligase
LTTLRCFIAIDLSPEVRRQLTSLTDRLRSLPGQVSMRWVQPDSIHLTLEFLGDLPPVRVPDVAAMLDQVCPAQVPFRLRVGGLGCFPDARRPRVLWVGLEEPTGSLTRLQAAIRKACADLGLDVDGRAFSPHLTLGRVRREAGLQAADFAREVLVGQDARAGGEMAAETVHLYRSDLRPAGAVYTRLHSASLAATI